MPQLLVFILKNIAIGAIVGWIFVGGLLWFDVGGLATIIFASQMKFVALALLAVFFAVTFGSAAVASAVLLGHDFPARDDDTQNHDPVTDGLLLAPAKAHRKTH